MRDWKKSTLSRLSTLMKSSHSHIGIFRPRGFAINSYLQLTQRAGDMVGCRQYTRVDHRVVEIVILPELSRSNVRGTREPSRV